MAVAKSVMKKAAKKVPGKAAGKATRRSKYAGRVAPPLVAAKIAEPLKFRIALETDDLNRLDAAAHQCETATLRIEAAAKAIAEHSDPNEKQLHRRVCVAVYDSGGVRISNTSYDLVVTDRLSLVVDEGAISGIVATRSAR